MIRLCMFSLIILFLSSFKGCDSEGTETTTEEDTGSVVNTSTPEEEPKEKDGEFATFSYSFEGKSGNSTEGQTKASISWMKNGDESLFRVLILNRGTGESLTISLQGSKVGGEQIPESFQKSGADDKMVGAGITLSSPKGPNGGAALETGSVVFTEVNLENGILKGKVTGTGKGQFTSESIASAASGKGTEGNPLEGVDMSDQKALQEALANNPQVQKMQQMMEEANKEHVGPISFSFELKTKSIMVTDLTKFSN